MLLSINNLALLNPRTALLTLVCGGYVDVEQPQNAKNVQNKIGGGLRQSVNIGCSFLQSKHLFSDINLHQQISIQIQSLNPFFNFTITTKQHPLHPNPNPPPHPTPTPPINPHPLTTLTLLYDFTVPIINIFSTPATMILANHTANSAIDMLIDRGGNIIYETYVCKKLPAHANSLNTATLYNNLSLHSVKQDRRTEVNAVPVSGVQKSEIDSRAPRRLALRKQIDGYSTLSPKNTTFGRSTNYQTIRKSQTSSTCKEKNNQPLSESITFQEQNLSELTPSHLKGRPMTMQTVRKPNSITLLLDSKLQQVQEKRAMSCHTRRRAYPMSRTKPQRFYRINLDRPAHAQEQELADRLRSQKIEHEGQEKSAVQQHIKMQTYMKQRRTVQNFEQLKSKLKGKSLQPAILTNFETDSGVIIINGRPKQQNQNVQQEAVVQLQFNKHEEMVTKRMQSQFLEVSPIKKHAFVAKLKKKGKISNEQFTNNGGRQTSSIPFMNLNYGIALSESTVQVSASRRRPEEELSRTQFTITNETHRFKSHNPLINSARIYATVEETGNQIGKCQFLENSGVERKELEGTSDSRREMNGSILWRAREISQRKKIRIANLQVFNHQFLEIKLAS